MPERSGASSASAYLDFHNQGLSFAVRKRVGAFRKETDGDPIRCDGYGCETATIFDVRTIAKSARYPEEIRRWFAMDGWKSGPGEGGSQGLLDFCPLH